MRSPRTVKRAGQILFDAVAPSIRRKIGRELAARAQEAAKAANYHQAAWLYDEALRLAPGQPEVHVQAGHMFKEAGDLGRAEDHYLRALKDMPDDADLALQLGHFYKVADRSALAAEQYRRALVLAPGWSAPAAELKALVGESSTMVVPIAAPGDEALVPELLPQHAPTPSAAPSDVITFFRLGGRRQRSARGSLPLLRGVEAVRAMCVSNAELTEATILVDAEPIWTGTPERHLQPDGRSKFVCNAWIDVSAMSSGEHMLELRLMDRRDQVSRRAEYVLIAPPISERRCPDSDAVVDPPRDGRPLERAVRERPSMVRPAARQALPDPVRTILVLRTDQLGDMIVSIPALRRLRSLYPEARLIGLVTEANVGLARQTAIFDEVLVADFPLDAQLGRRVMTRAEQTRLRTIFKSIEVDLAIDLCLSGVSRPLLKLSGAKMTAGFGGSDFPWLTVSLDTITRDPKNGEEMASHSTKLMALVERVATMISGVAKVVACHDIDRTILQPFGLESRRYAVIHAGASVTFTRWPGYPDLIKRLVDDLDVHVAVLTDNRGMRDQLDPALLRSGRVTLLDQRLTFEEFDTLLSSCSLFIGNDSGPKHLAALRGAPVVSIHCARLNWSEWGQEQTGVIISRRVPCAGCGITDAQDCGRDIACVRDVSVDEVYSAATNLLLA